MERKTIQGQQYVVEYITVETESIPIVGVVSDENHDFVKFESKRPGNLISRGSSAQYLISIDEYFTDFRFIYKYIHVNGISDKSIDNVFIELCVNHIAKSNRLIDTDLFTYIDLMVMARYTIASKFYEHEMSLSECQSLWTSLKDFSMNRFKNDLYVTKHDFSDPLNPKLHLEKLTNQ